MTTSSISAALDALRAGRMVVMTDDEDRENEGDLVLAAEFATPDAINFMVTHARGLVCLSLEPAQVDRLALPMMVADNRAPRTTAFTVSIEARDGVTTGISAHDRARTIQAAIALDATPQDLVSPGHVFPLRAVPGGVLARAGHTEGSIDLLRLGGLRPAAVICEVMSADGSMARMPELRAFAARHDLPVVTIADLVAHLSGRTQPGPVDAAIEHVATSRLPVASGDTVFTMHAFRDAAGAEHLALVKGDPAAAPADRPPLVRLHSECVTGDVFGSLRCDCGSQLQAAMVRIAAADTGVLLYLRGQEGRGIGLANKVRAYALQDEGLDTVEANHRLGFPADARDWSVAASILRRLGIGTLELLTNNPAKIAALQSRGFTVAARVPLEMPHTVHNAAYLRTKREKMGHTLVGAEPAPHAAE
jgi:3,4-dihydroxy 2-butanone 4-phosphate synthase/GTP cyclohydrolase II